MKVLISLVLLLLGTTLSRAQVYVESTFTGINFQAGFAGNMYSSEVLFKDRLFLSGADFRLSLGLSDNIGILGGFQYASGSSGTGNQILPFTFADQLTHTNWYGGAEYYMGSPQSKIRFKIFGQIGYASDELSVLYIVTEANKNVKLAGLNYRGGVAVHYFLQSYLSIQSSVIYHTGKYNYSELEGRSYKESLSYNAIQLLAGLAYHFGGR